jgi:hypothetical protein
MRQTTTAKVRLDAGKAVRFSASAQSTDWFDSCCARHVRFTVVQGAGWGDPGPTTAGNPGNVGPSVSATSSFPYSVTVVAPAHLETETFQVVRLNRIGSHFS